MVEKSGGKMLVEDDLFVKREDCSSDEKSCVEDSVWEFEEGRLGGEEVVVDGCKGKEVYVEEIKMECCLE